MSACKNLLFALCAVFAALVATTAGGCIDAEPEGQLGEPTLATVQTLIFTPKCSFADCHGGASPRQGMSLEPGKALGMTVNVQAVEAPLLRVKPGDPDKSYLVAKIEGRHRDVGGSGERMPLGFAPLSGAEIKLVRDWVTGLGKALAGPPKVLKITPAAAAVGDSIVVEGEGFGDDAKDAKVEFGAVAATFVGNWSNTKFEAIVPLGLSPGKLDFVVTVGEKKSSAFSFEVVTEKLASLISVEPDMGPVGTHVTLKGSNFGGTQGTSKVLFGGVDAGSAMSWANNEITVMVPTGAKSGDVTVEVNGKGSNGLEFFFLEPKFASLQAGVFTRRCALSACHGAATPPPDCGGKPGLSLLEGQAYANLVGVDACEQAGTQRVKAGDKAASFLFMKISMSSPPSGSQMPADGTAPLPAEVIQVIGEWIDQGAKND
ncbi:MAG: IPT/TIG domain-containing protein [Polyangiaceae bacterium]